MLYTVTVDTEEEFDWKSYPSTPPGLSNIERLPRFQDLCDRYGVAVTYFANHAVLTDPAARRTVLDVAARPRVEIGMHIHPWNTPPLSAHAVVPRDTFLHNLPADLARQKLETVLTAFRAAGLVPTSFRGGRYSVGETAREFLRAHRFLADASVLPFSTWSDDGAPDYRRRGLRPVRLPPRHAGERPLWEVPLTLGFTRRPDRAWRAVLAGCEKPPLRHLRLVGAADRLGVVRKVWLNLENPLGRDLLPFVQRLRRRGLPCVCFTLHSSSLRAGCSPYTRTPADEQALYDRADRLFRSLADVPGMRPATVTEVARQLEADFHARTRN